MMAFFSTSVVIQTEFFSLGSVYKIDLIANLGLRLDALVRSY